MKDETTPRTMAVRCGKCRAEDVSRDAIAYWSNEAQDWELSSVQDQGYCDSCGGEANLVERDLETGKPFTPGRADLYADELWFNDQGEFFTDYSECIGFGRWSACIAFGPKSGLRSPNKAFDYEGALHDFDPANPDAAKPIRRPTSALPGHIDDEEAVEILRILDVIETLRCEVSVRGEEDDDTPVFTRNRATIEADIGATDITRLRLRFMAQNVGTLFLVHGNGSDVLSDMSAPDEAGLSELARVFDPSVPQDQL